MKRHNDAHLFKIGKVTSKYDDKPITAIYLEINIRFPIRFGWWDRKVAGVRFITKSFWIPNGSFSIRIGRIEIDRWTGELNVL